MIRSLIIFILLITLQSQSCFASSVSLSNDTTIYFLAGQGADHRLFNNINLSRNYIIQHINYTVPEKGMTMEAYAKELSKQIDTTQPFILIGTSLGGMLATEMNDFLSPEKTIIISSARLSTDLPGRYRFQQKIPIYKLVGPRMAKLGARILQPVVEPDRRKEKETFKQMLKDKEPLFMNRSIHMIINWDRTTYAKDIIHIHGDKDHTIPIRKLTCDYVIDGGSHMMTLTRGEELSKLLNELLGDF